MKGDGLLPSMRTIGERIKLHKEKKINRKVDKLLRKISRLHVKVAKLDLVTSGQIKPKPCQIWRKKRWQRKIEAISKRAVVLQETKQNHKKLMADSNKLEPGNTVIWSKEVNNDADVLPPAYEDICQEPPPYTV